jgi:hypothetical protein
MRVCVTCNLHLQKIMQATRQNRLDQICYFTYCKYSQYKDTLNIKK